MKTLRAAAIGAAITIATCGLTMGGLAWAQTAPPAPPPGPPANPMILTSTSFADGGIIPDKYTQAVDNAISPALAWNTAPAGTQSFVLLGHDADGAVQKKTDDILHWLMFNIPADTRALPEGLPVMAQLPDGTIEAKNMQGKVGYMGPGSRGVYHHYMFELFALDTKLDLSPDASRADIFAAIQGHILGKAVYEGRFHR